MTGAGAWGVWGLGRPRRPALSVVAICAAAVCWARLAPLPEGLLDDRGGPSTIVVDRRGVALYESLSGEGTRSVRLNADDLPPTLVAATVAVEDRRFWSHPGIDPVALGRAVRRNLAEREVLEGGSTITQQVAKLLLNRRDPSRRRGWRAKAWEGLLALRLEHRFSKRDILAMYLNLANYGNQIAGAERASRAYFGRSAAVLTPAQAAFLAGLPQRPSGFNPYRSLPSALARQQSVIRRMEAAGALTAGQAAEARGEQLTLTRSAAPFRAPHFVEMVLAAAEQARAERLQTTLDAELQEAVEGIIRSHRPQLTRHGAANVAVVVLENATGQWLAWEGSGDYFDTAHGGSINGPLTPRQPGSALKPFTYALAFEHGFSPASVLPDIPSHFPTAETGVLYSPRNYDGRYRGPLLARRALAGSENVPAVALTSELGVPSLLRFLQRSGLTTFDRNASYYGLGVTLGNAEVRLDELVSAYAAFARGGEWIQPVAVVRADTVQLRRTLVSPRTAFWIQDILADNEAREFIFGRGGSLEFPFPVAVKTGTSQAYHDNWTVGYTPHVTVGVWVGNFDRKPLRQSSGVTGAAPIFHGVMLAAHARYGPGDARATPVAHVMEREVCSLSGLAANDWCPARRREWLAAEAPSVPCSWHHLADEGLLVVWPPKYRDWAKRNGLLAQEKRPRGGTSAVASAERREGTGETRRAALEIINPPSGSTYLIDPTLRREFQSLPLRVVSPTPTRIEWLVNGRAVGEASSDGTLMWPLTPGSHRLTARDARGRTAESTVVVR